MTNYEKLYEKRKNSKDRVKKKLIVKIVLKIKIYDDMMCRKEKTTILYHNQTFDTVKDKIKG